MDDTLELRRTDGELGFVSEGVSLVVTSINGEPAQDWARPSLNVEGEAIYRIATLSKTDPGSVTVEATGDGGSRALGLRLERSDHFSYSRDIFREDRVGGIPVLRIRSFSDHHSEHLGHVIRVAEIRIDARERCQADPFQTPLPEEGVTAAHLPVFGHPKVERLGKWSPTNPVDRGTETVCVNHRA